MSERLFSHLSEDQISQCAVRQPTRAERQHLAECAVCRGALDRFVETLAHFRSAVRNRIDGCVSQPRERPARPVPLHRWGPGWAVAAMLLGAVLLPLFVLRDERGGAAALMEGRPDPAAIMDRVNLHLSRTVPSPMEPLLWSVPNDEFPPEPGEFR